MTFDELKREYECTADPPVTSFNKTTYKQIKNEHERNMKESGNKSTIQEKRKNNLELIKNEKSKMLHEAYMIIMRLSKIPLKADSAFTLQHLEFLILRLKEEGKDEWMKNLEDQRKAGEEQRNKGALHFMYSKMNRFNKSEHTR